MFRCYCYTFSFYFPHLYRKVNWIGHILRRNCLLQQVIEGKIKGQIEVTRRRGRRCKKLLDDLKDRRGYCQLKEEALDRTMWRNRFGRGFGPVVWQITDDDDDDDDDVLYRASWYYRSFIYSPTDAVVSCLKNNTKIYINIYIFRCYSYTIIRERIKALPDEGVTVTLQHVGAVLM